MDLWRLSEHILLGRVVKGLFVRVGVIAWPGHTTDISVVELSMGIGVG